MILFHGLISFQAFLLRWRGHLHVDKDRVALQVPLDDLFHRRRRLRFDLPSRGESAESWMKLTADDDAQQRGRFWVT